MVVAETVLSPRNDHMVKISEVVLLFDEDQRKQFANDPLELLAVSGSIHESKGDGDAAAWLPPAKTYRCAYVTRQVAVKAKYKLWVNKPEKAAMERILARC